MTRKHAKRAPSSAHRWAGEQGCPGSVVLLADWHDTSSIYAKRGTCAHCAADEILSSAIRKDKWKPVEAATLIGKKYPVDGEEMTFDAEMAEWVDDYVERVGTFWSPGKVLYPERRVLVGHITGEDGAKGTSDCAIVDPASMEVIIIDLKTGSGVQVDAAGNEQLILYAAGAIHELELVWGEFKTVRIIQPPKRHYDEWAVDYPTFMGHVERIRAGGQLVDRAEREAIAVNPEDDTAWAALYLHPSEDNCRFCRPDCPARRRAVDHVTTEVASAGDFRDLGDNSLSTAMDKVGMVEDWCKDIRAECERRLFLGERVTGWKLVQGKQGNRAWNDAEAAERDLRALKVPVGQFTESKMKSVAQLEKIKKQHPDAWEAVQQHISRSPGKPSVAPASDPRPEMATNAVAADFREIKE